MAVFIYDGSNVLAEFDKDGTRINIYDSSMIATTGTDEVYYQYNNHGDVIRVSDRTGTLLNEYQCGADRRRDYDAFGNAITEIETVKNPYRYAGYYQRS